MTKHSATSVSNHIWLTNQSQVENKPLSDNMLAALRRLASMPSGPDMSHEPTADCVTGKAHAPAR